MMNDPVFKRVDVITGETDINLGVIGVSTRYVVAEDRCEVRIRFWFRIKLEFKTITISKTLNWVGCEEGLETAIALAKKFDADEIELHDPEGLISSEFLKKAVLNSSDKPE